METVLVIIAAVCCALCVYGINATGRRSKARRARAPHAPTPR